MLLAGIFAILQITSNYIFFYIEQTQMFQFSWPYIREKLVQHGGVTVLTGEFLTQFYVINYAGALISAILITLAGVLTSRIMRHIAPYNNLILLPLLVIITLLFTVLDIDHRIQGVISLLFALCCLLGYLKIEKIGFKMVYTLSFTIVLFLIAGPVHILFTGCITILEVLRRQKYWYFAFAAALLSATLSCIGIHSVLYEEITFAFLPANYFNNTATLESNLYLILLPICIIAAYFFRNSKPVRPKTEIIAKAVQFLIVIYLGWTGTNKYLQKELCDVLKIDHYAHMEQWDRIIELVPTLKQNNLNQCNLNMALAQKGELLERLFSFEQLSEEGLIFKEDLSRHATTLLSDIAFTIGNISMAQEMAFECNVICSFSNARMLKRLVQTNLIYGYHVTAERYVRMLEKSLFYRKWAKEHRRFLYNEQAIEADSLLQAKRADLFPENENHLSTFISYTELQRMAINNPNNSRPMEYALALSLFSGDLSLYKYLLETHFGTDALRALPLSCQEAVLIAYGPDPKNISGAARRYGVSEQVISNFNQLATVTRASGYTPAALKRQFGNTYWYYNITFGKR